ADQARHQGRRRVRVGEKTVGQIANQMSLGDRADDAQFVFAVAGVVVDEFADPRPRVVGGDEGELVRILSGAFDCADENFLPGHILSSRRGKYTVFKCIKTLSHRGHRAHREMMMPSVPCGALCGYSSYPFSLFQVNESALRSKRDFNPT